jgi:hypothetical protein
MNICEKTKQTIEHAMGNLHIALQPPTNADDVEDTTLRLLAVLKKPGGFVIPKNDYAKPLKATKKLKGGNV